MLKTIMMTTALSLIGTNVAVADETRILSYSIFCEKAVTNCPEVQATLTSYTPRLETQMQAAASIAEHRIKHVDDIGVMDLWQYPKHGEGDCEDIALYIRQLLINMGVPQGAIRLGTSKWYDWESNKVGHAFVVVMTDNGMYVVHWGRVEKLQYSRRANPEYLRDVHIESYNRIPYVTKNGGYRLERPFDVYESIQKKEG